MRLAAPLVLALAACAAPAPAGPAPEGAPLVPEDLRARSLELLDGFDPAEDAPDWRIGDRALYAVTLRTAGGEQTWLVRFEVAELDEEAVTYDVRVFDRDLVPSAPSRSRLRRADLGGAVEACELALRRVPDAAAAAARGEGFHFDAHESEVLVRAATSMITLLFAIEDDPVLREVLWDVVERPSLFSILTHLGVSLSFSFDFLRVERLELSSSGWSGPREGFRVPVALTVNGAPALELRFEVARALPPAHVGAGVVGADGVHPSDPWRRVRLQLVAARRGPAPGAPAP